MLNGIDLRDDQRAKIEAELATLHAGKPERPSFDAMRAKKKAALAAFASDRFDAAAMIPERQGAKGHLRGMVKALAVIVPLLDQGQRAQLADRLEKGKLDKGKLDKRRGAKFNRVR